jgi:hypothetical protein
VDPGALARVLTFVGGKGIVDCLVLVLQSNTRPGAAGSTLTPLQNLRKSLNLREQLVLTLL